MHAPLAHEGKGGQEVADVGGDEVGGLGYGLERLGQSAAIKRVENRVERLDS